MKTCKDCLHFSLCEYNTDISLVMPKVTIFFPNASEQCTFFQDYSEYVKLPVKIGDYLYTNISHQGWYLRKRDALYRVKVVFISLNDSENMGGGFFNVVFQNEGVHAFYFSDIGKTVFFTKEEAERMLRESETE